MASLLDGLRVIEISRTVRAAYAGAVLRDLGADITRLELRGERAAVPLLDADKTTVRVESLTSSPADQLIAVSDIVVHDLDADLAAELTACPRSGQVRVSVTARGSSAAGVDDPALLAAESGLAWEIGLPGRPPLPAPAGMTEAITGVHAAAAALWLHLHHLVSGEPPAHCEVAEVDVITSVLGTQLQLRKYYGGSRDIAARPARADLGSALSPTCLIEAADGVALMMMTEPSHLSRAKEVLSAEFAAAFPTFADVARHPADLQAHFQRWANGRTLQDLLKESQSSGLICAPFLGFDQLDHAGVLPMLRSSGEDELTLPAPWHVYTAGVPA